MSFEKVRLPLGVIGAIVGIILLSFTFIKTWNFKETPWTYNSPTFYITIIMIIGAFSLGSGLYCIEQDKGKLHDYLFGRSDSKRNGGTTKKEEETR